MRATTFAVCFTICIGSLPTFTTSAFGEEPSKKPPSLTAVYFDESHCLTAADMRDDNDNDKAISCYCRDAIVDMRYVASTYVFGPKRDFNMNGPYLTLQIRAGERCGKDPFEVHRLASANDWVWPGPEVVRTYPSDDVIKRITPVQANGGLWRKIPFTVQLVYRDRAGKITKTEAYPNDDWEPVVPEVK